MVNRPQVNVDMRADAPEPVEDLRHPAHGDTGVGRDADGLRRFFRDRGDLVFQPRIRAQKLADGGHERLAFLGQRNAAMVALHKVIPYPTSYSMTFKKEASNTISR